MTILNVSGESDRLDDMGTIVSVQADFHQWAFDTARAIREARFEGLDWERIAEELHSLGISEEHALSSHLAQVIDHLLKIEFQPERHGASWDISVRSHRERIYILLRRQPSLKSCLSDSEFLYETYLEAIAKAGAENLPDSVVNSFPKDCPYTVQQLLPQL